MSVSYRIHWNESEFRRITEVQTVPQAVWRAAGKVRDRAKSNLTSAGRVDTGALRQSITTQRVRGGKSGVWYEVGSNLPYAIYQHEGIGPVVPRRAKVLRFQPKGGSAYVFARRTRGFTGVPYLTDALKTLTINDFTS